MEKVPYDGACASVGMAITMGICSMGGAVFYGTDMLIEKVGSRLAGYGITFLLLGSIVFLLGIDPVDEKWQWPYRGGGITLIIIGTIITRAKRNQKANDVARSS